MDSARCVCHVMNKVVCPIHGQGPVDPLVPYVLNANDRAWLRRIRVSTKDPNDIADTYRSDLKERR